MRTRGEREMEKWRERERRGEKGTGKKSNVGGGEEGKTRRK